MFITMNIHQIITGEKIQSIADIFIGNEGDFNYNPYISQQTQKRKYLSDFENGQPYNNPRIVFCYGPLIYALSKIIHLFENPFILITHNSDENILPNKPEIDNMLNCKKIIRWYSQNVHVRHEKLYFLPIGIANHQWAHGNLYMFESVFSKNVEKTKSIYFNFNIDTNKTVRQECYNMFCEKIPFLENCSPFENVHRMAEYKFCICPNGNGLDTHRLWECFYLKVVPILLRNTYSEIIKETTGLPMILLDNWTDLNLETLNYSQYDFENAYKCLTMDYWTHKIINE